MRDLVGVSVRPDDDQGCGVGDNIGMEDRTR